MIFNQQVFTKHSAIHGKGVFATRFIRIGELAVKWEDTREISKNELDVLLEDEKNYIDIQKDKIFLIGKPERFINHSCNANTHPGELCDVASRDTQIGEQITPQWHSSASFNNISEDWS